eukprot:TRINITY_DN34522_c0_g1_i1.p1 TRINITY_DN34522_c0_g1~~TRINITY_DN34522_c0_g1_i1.p1  ORF type:complete len:1808 (-),score=356.33 TRINITY_DN34522_c0_g1_i1:226-5649(-)
MAMPRSAWGSHDDIAHDDAWIQAELERELLAMESIEIGSDDSESDDGVSADGFSDDTRGGRRAVATSEAVSLEKDEPTNVLSGADEDSGGPVVLPDRFKEFMLCLEEFDAEARESAAENAKEAQLFAEEFDRHMRSQTEEFGGGFAKAAGWVLSEEDNALLADVVAEVSQRPSASISAARSSGPGDEADTAFATSEKTEAEAAKSSQTIAERDIVKEGQRENEKKKEEEKEEQENIKQSEVAVDSASSKDMKQSQTDKDSQRLQPVLPSDATPSPPAAPQPIPPMSPAPCVAAEMSDAFQEKMRCFDDVRAARVVDLEHQQKEFEERTRRDEEMRRLEEQRLREECAMQSEEWRLRSFYSTERAIRHREHRAFVWEDRRGSQIREEEKQAQSNEERGREAAERQALFKEDVASANVRDEERRQREIASLCAEDECSLRCRESWRREEDQRRFAVADVEAQRWRAVLREDDERQRMAAEDILSELQRQCGVPFQCSAVDIGNSGRGSDGTHGGTGLSTAAAAVAAALSNVGVHVGAALFQPVSAGGTAAMSENTAAATLKTEAAVAAQALTQLMRPPTTSEVAASGTQRHLLMAEPGTNAARRSTPRRTNCLDADVATETLQPNLLTRDGAAAATATAVAGSRASQCFEGPCIDPWQDIMSLDADVSDREACAHGWTASCGSGHVRNRAGGAGEGDACGNNGDCLAISGQSYSRGRCSGLLCEALRVGAERWRRNGPEAWRRPLADCDEGSCQLPSPCRRHPSASSTAKAPRPRSAKPSELLSPVSDLDEELLLGCGVDAANLASLARLDLRMEGLEAVPDLRGASDLRVLGLTGNRLRDLAPLRHCLLLEELSVCQNKLATLDDVREHSRLTVLRATQNSIKDAGGISDLAALRDLELSGNRLSEIRLRAPLLARLELYQNALTSTTFLEHLPSLTHLDLRMNQITQLEPRLSEWNPLLTRVFLYKNRLRRLPELQLPLLTDLHVDHNELEVLGPLGFLPSLERLGAKNNSIAALSSPIAASPLLNTMELGFNQLPSLDSLIPAFTHVRLRILAFNDNPVVADFVGVLEKYRSWVLQRAPQLEELDNESVTEDERRLGVVARIGADPCFPYDVAAARQASWPKRASPRGGAADNAAANHSCCRTRGVARGVDRKEASGGLLGLTDVVEAGARCEGGNGVGGGSRSALTSTGTIAGDGEDAIGGRVSPLLAARGSGATIATSATGNSSLGANDAAANFGQGGCALGGSEALEIRRSALFVRWCSSGTRPIGPCAEDADVDGGPRAGTAGCDMCGVSTWCELSTAGRDSLIVAHRREERRAAAPPRAVAGDRGRGDVLLTLRRRQDFWTSLVDLCRKQWQALFSWKSREAGGVVSRVVAFEPPGAERSRHFSARSLQAHWRGGLARKRSRRLRFERRCDTLTERHRNSISHLQARWRGASARKDMVARGVPLPGTRRRELRHKAATQIQALVRGSRARRRLRWARHMARMVDDDLDDCPAVDVDALLGNVTASISTTKPVFELRVPVSEPSKPQRSNVAYEVPNSNRPSSAQIATNGEVELHHQRHSTTVGATKPAPGEQLGSHAAGSPGAMRPSPKNAWSTPPSTCVHGSRGAVAAVAPSPRATTRQVVSTSAVSSPMSSRGSSANGTRRCRSLSSTAESAVTEQAANATAMRNVDRVQQEWGFAEEATAAAYLEMQRRKRGGGRPKPPKIPGAGGNVASLVPSTNRVGGGFRNPGVSGRAAQSQPPARSGGRVVKAQDAIAEARRLQQQDDERAAIAAAQVSEQPPREFLSGSANLKLLRSSRSFCP